MQDTGTVLNAALLTRAWPAAHAHAHEQTHTHTHTHILKTSDLVARAVQASYSSKDHKIVVAANKLEAPAAAVDIRKSTKCRQTPQCCS